MMQADGPCTPPHSIKTSSLQGLGYTSSWQNSYMQTPSLSNDGTDAEEPSPGSLSRSPPSRVLMNEYTSPSHRSMDQVDEPETLRRTSTLYDEDPVAAHLLVETAIGDSQNCKVLSFDDLYTLKKEQDLVSRRIQGIRRNLHLESKVRNVAQSLNRLQSRTRRSGTQDSVRTQNETPSERHPSKGILQADSFKQTDDEAAVSTRKCEELAQELWKLERRQTQMQHKQLQHTAGILHMEHLFRTQEGQHLQPSLPSGVNDASIENVYSSARAVAPGDFLDLVDGTNSKSAKYHNDLISATEKRLQQLQERLQELVVLANPNSPGLNSPDSIKLMVPIKSNATVDESIENLNLGFRVLEEKINTLRSADAIETKIDDLNDQLYQILDSSRSKADPSYPSPPSREQRSDNPTQYLADGIYILKDLHGGLEKALEESGNRELSEKTQNQETNASLTKLWEIVKASEEDTRQRRLREGDQMPAEVLIPNEPFSIQSFSTKVQRLCTRSSDLADQHSVLRQQINQQREAHSSHDTERSGLLTQLQEAQDKHLAGQRLLEDTKTSLTDTSSRLVQAQRDVLKHKEQLDAKLAAQDGISTQLTNLRAEHTILEAEVVRLQTELTVARADLDAAHGTRAERAAELAANQEKLGELESVRALKIAAETRVEALQRELEELVGEYEEMVKLSVEGEKEREALESTVDSLREKCEELEVSVNEQRVHSMGNKPTPSVNGVVPGINGSREVTSMTVMRTEFKKMMRDARAEHFKQLKIEQDERRRLENVIRTLRKEQTNSLSASAATSSTPAAGSLLTQTPVGKSGLSNSIIAS